ncbi:hypothetical protein C8R47DRAFT_1228912 [Mycena vitilis]|nr:hypothetical protein C8R47DRAFT_1228912 [Mycena vitilis]
MDKPHPLKIEELLDHCISYLHDCPRDLKACALVSRLWVSAAQGYLFHAPSLLNSASGVKSGINVFWTRLLSTLEASPHLIRHVRDLDIRVTAETTVALSTICGFPFTHVQSVRILYIGDLSVPAVAALQHLLGLPTLQRVYLSCAFGDREEFLRLWDRGAPGIRHVELSCEDRPSDIEPLPQSLPLTARDTPIVLQSLSLTSTQALDYDLLQAPSPFDLSNLKVLRVGWQTQVPWQDFVPVVQSIESLSIIINANTANTLHLSSLPRLIALRMRLLKWIPAPKMLSMLQRFLSGISPANIIRKIVISADPVTLDGTLLDELDIRLSSLPLLYFPVVEFEIDQYGYDGVRPYLHRLNSKNLVRRTDHRDIWW